MQRNFFSQLWQGLLLQVTPPATETPLPPTATRTGAEAASPFAGIKVTSMVLLLAALAVGGWIAVVIFRQRKS